MPTVTLHLCWTPGSPTLRAAHVPRTRTEHILAAGVEVSPVSPGECEQAVITPAPPLPPWGPPAGACLQFPSINGNCLWLPRPQAWLCQISGWLTAVARCGGHMLAQPHPASRPGRLEPAMGKRPSGPRPCPSVLLQASPAPQGAARPGLLGIPSPWASVSPLYAESGPAAPEPLPSLSSQQRRTKPCLELRGAGKDEALVFHRGAHSGAWAGRSGKGQGILSGGWVRKLWSQSKMPSSSPLSSSPSSPLLAPPSPPSTLFLVPLLAPLSSPPFQLSF